MILGGLDDGAVLERGASSVVMLGFTFSLCVSRWEGCTRCFWRVFRMFHLDVHKNVQDVSKMLVMPDRFESKEPILVERCGANHGGQFIGANQLGCCLSLRHCPFGFLGL